MSWKLGSLSRLGGMDREQLARHARHLPLLVTLVLILAIAHALADITWRLVPVAEEKGRAPVSAAAVTDAPGEGERVDIDRLLALSMFGEADPAEDPERSLDLSDVDAPETQLNLELRGVLATELPDMARAIIASGSGEDRSYRIGDSVGSGASLRAIYSDRVILERGGDLETLRLPRDEDAREGLALGNRQNAQAAADDEIIVPDELAEMRSEILEDPERITDVIRPTPHHVDGEMVGFRIFPGRQRDAFRSLGLQAGDIVTAINGQPMDSAAAGMSLLNDLEDASSVELTIEREGRQTSVTISLAN